MKKRITRLSAILLSLVMVMTMIPMTAFAADTYKYELTTIAMQLREGMLKRSDTVKLYYKAKEVVDMGEFEKHTFKYRKDRPFAGDYLKYNVKSCERSSISGIKSGSYIYQAFTMKMSYLTDAEQQKAIESHIAAAIDEMNFNGMDTDYYKASVIFDYVSNHAGDSAFAPLNTGDDAAKTAVIFYSMLISEGIENAVVTSGSHSWNIINIGGNWYNADATSGAFLKSDYTMSTMGSQYARDTASKALASCPADYEYAHKTPDLDMDNVAETGKLSLDWSHMPGVESYNIYRKTADSEYALLTTVNASEYVDNDTVAGTKYFYYVEPVMENGSDYRTAEKYRCTDLPAPKARSMHTSAGNLKIYWGEVEGATKYYVYKSTSATKGFTKIATTSKAYYVDKKGKSGKVYYYKVIASFGQSNADSAYSNTAYRRRK